MGEGVENKIQRSLTPEENAAIISKLFDVEVKEKRIARQIAWLQLAVTLAVASVVYGAKGAPQIAMAVLGGGGVSVFNSTLLAWRMSRVTKRSAHNTHLQLRLMYFYAAERFLAVVVLLGLCLVVLRLSPPAVLGGFVMGQAVLLITRLFMSNSKT